MAKLVEIVQNKCHHCRDGILAVKIFRLVWTQVRQCHHLYEWHSGGYDIQTLCGHKSGAAINYSLIAAIPGNTFPSKYSSNAPPPVDT